MRRHHHRRKHGSDEREAVGRAGDIAVGQARARERGGGVEQTASRCVPRSAGSSDRRARETARCACLRAPAVRRARAAVKMAAIVGRVQLASEPHAPAVRRVQPRDAVDDALEDAQVGLAAQLGYGKCVSAERFDERRGQCDRMRAVARPVAAVGNRLELGRVVDAEAAGDMARRLSDGRRADEKSNASVNRKYGAPIVEAADGVDARAASAACAAAALMCDRWRSPPAGRGRFGRHASSRPARAPRTSDSG